VDNISKHITYREATKSYTAERLGIDNIPNDEQLVNMKTLADNVFEPLREGLDNKPINIAIFFRSPELNSNIPGASSRSEHMAYGTSAAIDLDNDGREQFGWPSNRDIFFYIKNNLEFRQLIWEHGDNTNPSWVHVSYNPNDNKKQILKAIKVGNRTKYINFT